MCYKGKKEVCERVSERYIQGKMFVTKEVEHILTYILVDSDKHGGNRDMEIRMQKIWEVFVATRKCAEAKVNVKTKN